MNQWETKGELQETSPIREILAARGVSNIEGFLNPELNDLYKPEYNPFLLKDMAVGVARIHSAIETGEQIRIAGDYDADGITSTSLFIRGLRDLGADVSYKLPKRSEGYGLSKASITAAAADGVTLIITCDNGISLVEEVTYAKSLGIDVVITDHHEPGDIIPQALAVINPKQKDCGYVTKELCGCGVVFKVLQALNEVIHGDMAYVENYLDIVALGTVADMMKLTGENRLFVKFGLDELNDTANRGLQQLLDVLDLSAKPVTAKSIGMLIAPTLNAVGRLKDASEAVELLLTNSKREAHRIAKSLKETNEERRKLTEEWTKKTIDFIEANPALESQKVMIVPFDDEVPDGLVGLIASKLKEKYNKPTILLAPIPDKPGMYKGSGRSVSGYDMFAEISLHRPLMDKFGGHPGACGMSLQVTNISELTMKLNAACKLKAEDLVPKLYIDYEIDPEHITREFAADIEKMEPFGAGNSKPLFLLRDAKAADVKYIGEKTNHLKFKAMVLTHQIDVIGFSMVSKWEALNKPERVDIAFYPGLNTWNGRTNVQLMVKDIREAEVSVALQ